MMPAPLSPNAALALANKIRDQRFPDSLFGIATGSLIFGTGTTGSDLDMVIVYPHLRQAYRESFECDGLPIEVFVHDPETLQATLEKDYETTASMLYMIDRGVIFPENFKEAAKLKKYVSSLLAKGPEPLTTEKRDALRYFIGDCLDDLRGERPPAVKRAILYQLYSMISELVSFHHGRFLVKGKRIPQQMMELAPSLYNSVEEIMKKAHDDCFDAKDIDRIADALSPYGGPLFEGYKSYAPAEKRKSALWLSDTP